MYNNSTFCYCDQLLLLLIWNNDYKYASLLYVLLSALGVCTGSGYESEESSGNVVEGDSSGIILSYL